MDDAQWEHRPKGKPMTSAEYRVRKSPELGWDIYGPNGNKVCSAYHFPNAVWLAHTFAVRAGVRERMRERHGR